MENQHRKIAGYRELSQVEVDLMNRIKAHAQETGLLIAAVADYLVDQPKSDEGALPGGPLRWVSIARTHLQQGFMALTRSVAQPTTF